MKAGATPSDPWSVSADNDVHLKGDARKIVAWCAEPNSGDNARLIAAAPNMLAVLLEIQSNLRELIGDERSNSKLISEDLAEDIRATIAKATRAA
jgi:hypothetical protein